MTATAEPIPTATFLDHALAGGRRGLRVFPCVPGGKLPMVPEFYNVATTDPAEIERLWTDPVTGWPQPYNVGVATDGMIVVDADEKNGKRGLASYLDLELPLDTLTVRTPTGGKHFYLSGPNVSLSVEKLGDGLDIRSFHGYVLGVGSVTSDGEYSLELDAPMAAAPAHLIARLDAPRDRVEKLAATDLDTDFAIARAAKYLREEAPAAIEGQGGDDCTFRVACIVKDMGLSVEGVFDVMVEHYNGRCAPPWDLDELRAKVDNAFAYALSAAGSQTPDVDLADVGGVLERRYLAGTSSAAAAMPLKATPFVLGDMTALPRRQWLYGKHLIRKFISAKVAPSGVGKSALGITEALAMASGRDLLGQGLPAGPLRTWMFNLEDPRDELQLRIGAAMMHYKLTEADLGGRLFVDSGREQSLVIAEQTRDGARLCVPVVDALVAELRARQIDAMSVDPFVSSHRITENDNNAMDLVAKEWARVADRANCAIELVHHTRKLNGAEVTADSGRGAGALKDAARSVLTLNRMTVEEAQRAGVDDPRRYFRVFADKANLAPPTDASDWYRLVSVYHPNGDDVGVVERWAWPDPFDDITADDLAQVRLWVGTGGRWRENHQSTDWVGHAIGQAVGVDTHDKGGRAKVLSLVKTWLRSGVLVVVERPDSSRKLRKFVEVRDEVASPEEAQRPTE